MGLTKQLVCANITIVMEHTSLTSTREKLMQAGLAHFYQKGYRYAGLRQICADCGVTTGAFYFFFENKDALFCAIVDPVIQMLNGLTSQLCERELSNPSSFSGNDLMTMDFLLKHRRDMLVLMEKSQGSSREDFPCRLFDTMVSYFNDAFAAAIGRQPRADVIRMLVQIRIASAMDILKGAETMEQAFFLNNVMAHYADGGFNSLVHNLKDVL